MGTDSLWIIFLVALLIVCLSLWSYFHNRQRGLRVLLYHKIRPVSADTLTVSRAAFVAQLDHLRTAGYALISLPDLLTAHRHRTALPRRAVLLTVDDAYADFVAHLLPVLQPRESVTLFVPMAHIGGQNAWDGGQEPLLSAEQLRAVDSNQVSLAYHSYQHDNYKNLTPDQIEADLRACSAVGSRLGLSMQPAFAYPFGGRPRDPAIRQRMEELLEKNGIEVAFRIGNRINDWPVRSAFALNRIDVRGGESLATFRWRLRFGRIG